MKDNFTKVAKEELILCLCSVVSQYAYTNPVDGPHYYYDGNSMKLKEPCTYYTGGLSAMEEVFDMLYLVGCPVGNEGSTIDCQQLDDFVKELIANGAKEWVNEHGR